MSSPGRWTVVKEFLLSLDCRRWFFVKRRGFSISGGAVEFWGRSDSYLRGGARRESRRVVRSERNKKNRETISCSKLEATTTWCYTDARYFLSEDGEDPQVRVGHYALPDK